MRITIEIFFVLFNPESFSINKISKIIMGQVNKKMHFLILFKNIRFRISYKIKMLLSIFKKERLV